MLGFLLALSPLLVILAGIALFKQSGLRMRDLLSLRDAPGMKVMEVRQVQPLEEMTTQTFCRIFKNGQFLVSQAFPYQVPEHDNIDINS